MTTLARGRENVERSLDQCPDPVFRERGKLQNRKVTLGDNPHYTFELLPPDEQAKYGWMENHPHGWELCFRQWISSGAAQRFAREYEAGLIT